MPTRSPSPASCCWEAGPRLWGRSRFPSRPGSVHRVQPPRWAGANGAWLVLARAAQGLGGAILAPATLSLLTTNFPAPDERRKALGAWSATAASGAPSASYSAVLTQLVDWRWVLFINVPIGAALIVVTALAVEESRSATPPGSFDLAGAITVTAGLANLVYGIVGADTHSWGSPATIVPLALGATLLALFLVIEARSARHPLVPLGVFRIRSLSVSNGIAMALGSALFGFFFFLTLYATGQRLRPSRAASPSCPPGWPH